TLDHRLDLRLDIVRLIDHISYATGIGITLSIGADDLIKDAEEFERVLRANDQIIIGISAIVEMEATQPIFVEQLRNNLRDVCSLWMVAGIHQHLSLWTKFLGHQEGRPPIREVGRIKRRLEELILDQ